MNKLLGMVIVASLAGCTFASADETTKYKVTFNATWNNQSHPLDYPKDALLSGLIGATHNQNYYIFVDGKTATDGLEALFEKGAHSPLDTEIIQSISSGDAGSLFESGPLLKFPGNISAQFTADEKYPLVSVVAMIAPSPDWFTGVSNVSLKHDGKWIDTVTLPLLAWDAGTDFGSTYLAKNADAQPSQSVRINASLHFAGPDGIAKIGTVTFTRISTVTN